MAIQNKSTDPITSKVWSIVNALAHRSAIVESDARAWVQEVVGMHGEAAIWHAIRLNGFGGSEIGVLVRNHAGLRADHQASAHDIVAGKLMRKTPSESSGHLQRGHENEESHAKRFYAKYGATRDVEAYNALKDSQGKHPWMRYSPDDVVRMPVELRMTPEGVYYPSQAEANDGRRWLIDYKAPSKVEQGEEVAFQYGCQLTQGAILCAENGIQIDGMMLSQFDWANWVLKDDVVAWDEQIGHMVLDAGDHYWQFVTQGKVPDYIRTPEMTGMDEYTREHLTAAQMYASLSALSTAAKDQADKLREILLKPVNKMRLNGQKISFGEVNAAPTLTLQAKQMLDRDAVKKYFSQEQLDACSGAKKLNPDLMEAYLRSANVDLKPFRVADLDATKVYALAAQIGLDADVLVAEQLTLAPSKSIKADMQEYIASNFPLSAVALGGEVPQEQLEDAPVDGG